MTSLDFSGGNLELVALSFDAHKYNHILECLSAISKFPNAISSSLKFPMPTKFQVKQSLLQLLVSLQTWSPLLHLLANPISISKLQTCSQLPHFKFLLDFF